MQIVLHLKTNKLKALEIIKLNARHFRFNQPPATSEINSIHKSSQKKKKTPMTAKGEKQIDWLEVVNVEYFWGYIQFTDALWKSVQLEIETNFSTLRN